MDVGLAVLTDFASVTQEGKLNILGIFGEYLARMHFRAMERPPYTQLQQTECADPRASSLHSHVREL